MEPAFLKSLSCGFNGTLVTKSSPEDKLTLIADDIQLFYRYLSVGGKSLSPIWSAPYIDYFSGQELMSVAIPIYYIE